MIASVHGRVAALGAGRRGGRGRRGRPGGVLHARARWPGCGSARPARLSTSLVVREDSLTLYGFADDDERAVFELLQTATGVGPRLAQAMLGGATAARGAPRGRHRGPRRADPGARHRPQGRRAHRARAQGPDRRASTAPGRGRAAGVTAVAPWRDQVAHALVGLGWSAREADEAVDRGRRRRRRTAADVAALLRAALRMLSRVDDTGSHCVRRPARRWP